ncbi:MAG: hypothetical protein UT02_C0027G0013 [Parcubacteria group bacterium GW2011_GWC2_38_7]|nr:MAG: hypothetical protein UT02_C0027G0013 [Parcubacteria group bacterium GW2011_GWC2_38_7]
MGFEQFGVKPERQFNQELGSLSQEVLASLQEAGPEDRSVFRDLKRFERDFLKQSI